MNDNQVIKEFIDINNSNKHAKVRVMSDIRHRDPTHYVYALMKITPTMYRRLTGINANSKKDGSTK